MKRHEIKKKITIKVNHKDGEFVGREKSMAFEAKWIIKDVEEHSAARLKDGCLLLYYQDRAGYRDYSVYNNFKELAFADVPEGTSGYNDYVEYADFEKLCAAIADNEVQDAVSVALETK